MNKVLIDSNVIIDSLTERDCNFYFSRETIRYILKGEVVGYIIAKQITDIFYSLKKYIGSEQKRRELIRLILDSFVVIPTISSDLKQSLNSEMDDYEDAVLDEIAKVNCLDFIVTNNVDDFKKSKSVILSPMDFVNLFITNN